MKELYSFYKPHDRVIFECDDELITKQSSADECDINKILQQFSRTGIIEHINQSQAEWLDLPAQMDLQESMQIIQTANDAFASLPALVREHYQNSPSSFLHALQDPKEKDRLTEWGVFKAPALVASQPAPTAPPPAPSGGGA